jgi:hypothetical protein
MSFCIRVAPIRCVLSSDPGVGSPAGQESPIARRTDQQYSVEGYGADWIMFPDGVEQIGSLVFF